MVEIPCGAKVVDKNGRFLGTIDHLIRNTWTGELSKFAVRRQVLDNDLFLSPQDTSEVTEGMVKLSVTLEGLRQRQVFQMRNRVSSLGAEKEAKR